MDYTPEQMAKLIVLAETLMRSRPPKPNHRVPSMALCFRSFDDANRFEIALADATYAVNTKPPIHNLLARLGLRN